MPDLQQARRLSPAGLATAAVADASPVDDTNHQQLDEADNEQSLLSNNADHDQQLTLALHKDMEDLEENKQLEKTINTLRALKRTLFGHRESTPKSEIKEAMSNVVMAEEEVKDEPMKEMEKQEPEEAKDQPVPEETSSKEDVIMEEEQITITEDHEPMEVTNEEPSPSKKPDETHIAPSPELTRSKSIHKIDDQTSSSSPTCSSPIGNKSDSSKDRFSRSKSLHRDLAKAEEEKPKIEQIGQSGLKKTPTIKLDSVGKYMEKNKSNKQIMMNRRKSVKREKTPGKGVEGDTDECRFISGQKEKMYPLGLAFPESKFNGKSLSSPDEDDPEPELNTKTSDGKTADLAAFADTATQPTKEAIIKKVDNIDPEGDDVKKDSKSKAALAFDFEEKNNIATGQESVCQQTNNYSNRIKVDIGEEQEKGEVLLAKHASSSSSNSDSSAGPHSKNASGKLDSKNDLECPSDKTNTTTSTTERNLEKQLVKEHPSLGSEAKSSSNSLATNKLASLAAASADTQPAPIATENSSLSLTDPCNGPAEKEDKHEVQGKETAVNHVTPKTVKDETTNNVYDSQQLHDNFRSDNADDRTCLQNGLELGRSSSFVQAENWLKERYQATTTVTAAADLDPSSLTKVESNSNVSTKNTTSKTDNEVIQEEKAATVFTKDATVASIVKTDHIKDDHEEKQEKVKTDQNISDKNVADVISRDVNSMESSPAAKIANGDNNDYTNSSISNKQDSLRKIVEDDDNPYRLNPKDSTEHWSTNDFKDHAPSYTNVNGHDRVTLSPSRDYPSSVPSRFKTMVGSRSSTGGQSTPPRRGSIFDRRDSQVEAIHKGTSSYERRDSVISNSAMSRKNSIASPINSNTSSRTTSPEPTTTTAGKPYFNSSRMATVVTKPEFSRSKSHHELALNPKDSSLGSYPPTSSSSLGFHRNELLKDNNSLSESRSYDNFSRAKSLHRDNQAFTNSSSKWSNKSDSATDVTSATSKPPTRAHSPIKEFSPVILVRPSTFIQAMNPYVANVPQGKRDRSWGKDKAEKSSSSLSSTSSSSTTVTPSLSSSSSSSTTTSTPTSIKTSTTTSDRSNQDKIPSRFRKAMQHSNANAGMSRSRSIHELHEQSLGAKANTLQEQIRQARADHLRAYDDAQSHTHYNPQHREGPGRNSFTDRARRGSPVRSEVKHAFEALGRTSSMRSLRSSPANHVMDYRRY